MTTATLQNAADSYTLERAPASNYNGSTKLYTRTQTGQGCRSFLHFGIPFPKGVTILSAKLRLYSDVAVVGSVTNVVQRIASSWSTSRITWSNQPGVTGATVSLTKASPAAGTLWEFDVTALMQTISGGATWYGFRINNTTTLLTRFHSAQAASMSLRPTLEITWSDVPFAPTQLYPSGGRAVGINKPTLQFNFADISGDKTLQAVNVQINATDVWTAPSFDSGTVLTDVPELDLSTTAYAGVGAGATVFWRVRVQDGAGLWSNWSASTSFQYQSQGTLTVNNPTFAEVFRNTTKNPRAATVATGWISGGPTGTSAITRVATGGPSVSDTFARATWSVAATGSGSYIYTGATLAGTYAWAVVPGETWSTRFWARASFGSATFQARINFYTSAGVFISSVNGTTGAMATNLWLEQEVEGALVPATAAFAVPILYHTGGVNPGIGATLDMTAVVTVKAAAMPTTAPVYWDGASLDTNEFDYSWSGVAEQSDSILKRPIVEDATPIISWALTGRTQAAFEIQVYNWTQVLNRLSGAGLMTTRRLKWTSGKINGATTTYTLPAGVLSDTTQRYELVVRTWDTILREATPNSPISVEVVRVFTLTNTTATTPAATLTSTLLSPYPWVTLNWTRTSMPDKWNITRNGKVVAVLEGDDPFVSGTSYTYTDRRPTPRTVNTYAAVAVVNGRGSASNPTTAQTPKASTTLLVDVDGDYPVLIYSADKDARLEDDAFVFEPTGNAPPIVIFSATVNGLRGSIKGVLDHSVVGLTAAEMRARFETLADAKGQKLLLTMVDQTLEVFILNAYVKPRVVDGGSTILYEVSFEFYQTDAS